MMEFIDNEWIELFFSSCPESCHVGGKRAMIMGTDNGWIERGLTGRGLNHSPHHFKGIVWLSTPGIVDFIFFKLAVE